jgi:hypothetical protein
MLTPNPLDSEKYKLSALYEQDQKGISPIHKMQQNLIQLISVAATASVITFGLHNPDAHIQLTNFADSTSIDFYSLKGETIEATIENVLAQTYAGQRLDTHLYNYAALLGIVQPDKGEVYALEELDSYTTPSLNFPISHTAMEQSIKYLNLILQNCLKIGVAPGEGYKEQQKALRKLCGEKGSVDKMTDLARISVIFQNPIVADIFSRTLPRATSLAQELHENPLECSGFKKWQDRFQASGYYATYGYVDLLGQPCEVQLCHQNMVDVYQVTHDLYEVERIIAENTDLSSKLNSALQVVKISLDSFDVFLNEVTHPKLSANGQWFAKITHQIMNVFGQKPESVRETFEEKRKVFDTIATQCLENNDHSALRNLGHEAWELRQLCHLVSVYGRPIDQTYQQRYQEALEDKHIKMLNESVDWGNLCKPDFDPKINVFLQDQLRRWGIMQPKHITASSPITDFLWNGAVNHL